MKLSKGLLLFLLSSSLAFVGWSFGDGQRPPEPPFSSAEPSSAGQGLGLTPASNQIHLFAKGGFIIPMDTTYQDTGILLAYGLLYKLLKEGIPVHWVIKAGKKLAEADFSVTSKDLKSGQALPLHGYRGGPFVIEKTHAAKALPILQAWQTAHPTTTIHQNEADFQARTGRYLTAAPTIAVIADDNEKIAFAYLNAAKIPDSKGNPWPLAEDKTRVYPNHPDVLDIPEVAGPTTTNHRDGKLFRPSGLPAYCQIMTMHWDVAKVVDEVVAEYREFLKFPTHVFSHCQGVNAIENNPFGRFLTPKGFLIDNRLSGQLSFLNLDTPFAQMDGPFEVVGGSERAYSLPPGDQYLARNVVMITDAANGPGQRDVWMTGFLDGKCSINEDDLSCPDGVGKVSYLGGHAYDIAVPLSKNPKTQGTRLFLNSLFEASCATDEGQPRVSLVKQGPSRTDQATVSYTLFYNNFGAGAAYDVTLQDTLPAGSTYVSSTQGGQAAGGVVTWKIGDLAKGQRGSVQVTVTLPKEGVYTNRFRSLYTTGVSAQNAESNEVVTVYVKPGSEATFEPPPTDGGLPEGSSDQGLPEKPPADIPVLPGEANCQPPNLLLVLDRSGSMKLASDVSCPQNDCLIVSGKACTQASDCQTMPRTAQPAPGTSPLYPSLCTAGFCKYTRWDVAQNAVNEVGYQYGGTAAASYRDRKVHFGLVSFNQTASLDAGLLTDPPLLKAAIGRLQAGGGTHYTSALLEAQKHLKSTVDRDPVSGRATHLLLITDGEPSEGCQSPTSIVNDLFTGTGPYRLEDKKGLVYKVKTYVIGFGSGINTAAKTCLAELAKAGGTQRCNPSLPGCVAYYFADNESQLRSAFNGIINNATAEVCDGKDNDCNGKIDDHPSCTACQDGERRPCYTGSPSTEGKGACKSGTSTCTSERWGACQGEVLPTAEVCDGVDNNCNGTIDEDLRRVCKTPCGEGQEICRSGTWQDCSAPQVTPEICDGLDNDCDGKVDEVGCTCKDGDTRPCYTGPQGTSLQGTCKGGLQLCTQGAWESLCRGEILPTAEICKNGKDDDCDGQIDEGCASVCKDGEKRPCPVTCGSGSQTCVAGAWASCEGVTSLPLEICDGKDNDCDGQIDEALVKGCQTPCGTGIDRCISGQWTGCQGRQPTAEICDGFDNDCDGKVDEQASCDGGAVCTEGLCPKPCNNGECPTGFVCQNDRCLPRASCNQTSCSQAEVCQGGKCVSVCSLVQCPAGLICWQGQCGTPDCYTLGCPQGQVCQQGVCILRPCAGLSCAADEYCKAGRCIKLCDQVTCPAKERCVEGACVADPCSAVSCDAGKICAFGTCFPDPCQGITCPSGRVCERGGCIDDPCGLVQCPTGLSCQGGVCLDLCKGKTCAAGEICKEGRCVINDCYHLGCADRRICQEGRCVEDLCKDKRCAASAFCRAGVCVASCQAVSCKAGETCRDGACEVDPCAVVRCAAGKVCQEGQCTDDLCQAVTCAVGRICQPTTGLCVDDPCLAIQCPQGERCQGDQCISSCQNVVCPQGFLCEKGICVTKDCYTEGCPQGQRCRESKCTSDPCSQKTCPASEFCRDGLCILSCAGISCSSGQTCQDGVCKDDPCAAVPCKAGEFCLAGACKPNPCFEIFCGKGRICDPAKAGCIDDPCASIQCPAEQTCVLGQCQGSVPAEATKEGGILPGQKETGVGQDGGPTSETGQTPGGCQCTSNDFLSWEIGFFLFLLLFVRRQKTPFETPTLPPID